MAFTRNWDETFPPHTQAANLLGQDIRNLKEDIRERIAALSGLFADRPALGDMITDWSSYGGNGVLYFATDTGAVYQWDGAAWVVAGLSKPTLGFVFGGFVFGGLACSPSLYLLNLTACALQIRSGDAMGLEIWLYL